MARWLTLLCGTAAFLAAAKAHGRQLRLERVLAGYLQVTFGGRNAEWVEAFWRQERRYFWSAALLLGLASLALRVLAARMSWALPFAGNGARPLIGALLLHGLLPALAAFTLTGLASAARTGQGGWASVGWWSLTLAATAATCLSALRR